MKSVLLVYGLLLSFGLSVTVGLLTRRMFELERSRSRHHLAEGRKTELARGILRVQEEERLRLSRELHDELGQLLTGIRVELDVIRRTDSSSSCGDSTYEAMYRLVDMALDSVRRLCRGLRPPALDDLGLVAACRQLTGEFASRSHIELDLQIGPNLDSLRLPGEIGVTFYRVLQESLTNVSRHSRATQVKVSLHRDHDELVLTVADDGKGFDPDSLTGRDGMGLVGMRERSRLIDGNLVLHSDRHAGTRITFRAPI